MRRHVKALQVACPRVEICTRLFGGSAATVHLISHVRYARLWILEQAEGCRRDSKGSFSSISDQVDQ